MGAKQPKQKTATFLPEVPLQVEAGQAKRLHAHLEVGRQFYNAVLSEGQKRLRRMRADPAWQEARAIPRAQKQERRAAFSALRERYRFSEADLHAYTKEARVSFLADHVDAVLAQTLATRAYQALNRVCVGKAKRVRFKSRGRRLDSIENKRNDTGWRFVLQKPEEGHAGYLLWHGDQLRALINWNDPVVKYGLDHRIKYARLMRRPTSSPRAQGADCHGYRYFVQLALEGVPYHKPRHPVGTDTIGLDLGPSTIASVAREGEARLQQFCEEVVPDARAIRRLQRQMDRQRRAGNPNNYDAKKRIKKGGKNKLVWKTSKGYQATQSDQRAQAGCSSQEPTWPTGPPDRACGQHHPHREAFLQRLAETLRKERGAACSRDVYRDVETHRGRVRAAPCTRFPPSPPSSPNTVTAVVNIPQSRSRSGFITALVASGRCSAICMRRFWRPTSIQQNSPPRVPSMSFPGKVRRRACGQHTSE